MRLRSPVSAVAAGQPAATTAARQAITFVTVDGNSRSGGSCRPKTAGARSLIGTRTDGCLLVETTSDRVQGGRTIAPSLGRSGLAQLTKTVGFGRGAGGAANVEIALRDVRDSDLPTF